MTEYCYLCGKFVEVVHEGNVWGLSQPSSDESEIVCDRCVNSKLNFGEPRRGGCLYCDEDTDYVLRKYTTKAYASGFGFIPNSRKRPIICEDHLEELDESDQEQIMSIENTHTSKDELQPPDVSIPETIGQEEGPYLEYKETFQCNPHTGNQQKSLKSKVVKEVAAFGNSEGGVVVIGVNDSKQVTGLESDYRSMDKERDGFALEVGDIISSNIGPGFAAEYTSTEFHEIDGKDVFAIRVDPSPNPLFTADDSFYVRQGSSSRPLETEETVSYISNHWET